MLEQDICGYARSVGRKHFIQIIKGRNRAHRKGARINESNNKRFNVYLVNTDYADVVNRTVKNRCVFAKIVAESEGT